ncbi:hypothetical protein M422DRAFT_30308 [Sphaerobolus stellatus SS14]|uniref:Uncharacterized protein n=1 Tax=Sphaerobolus stellatus (strain SS14) TaxID=990650 RepID=A0A0C9VZU9_SPHS4|nr:hypothetical protein M422DRAFT_30308 [Sphaerobolus stellatus SS14]
MSDEDVRSISSLSIGASSYLISDQPDSPYHISDSPALPKSSTGRTHAIHVAPMSTPAPSASVSVLQPRPLSSDFQVAQRIGRLRLVFSGPDKDSETHYAVVAIPASYADAILVAIRVFSRYSDDLRTDNVILRYRDLTRAAQWIWADIEVSNWSIFIHSGDEVGVFLNTKPVKGISEWDFTYGKIKLTVGARQGSNTKWSSICSNDEIDRPKNFEEAKKFVLPWVRLKQQKHNGFYYDIKPVDRDKEFNQYRFFIFTCPSHYNTANTDTWVEFPPEAYIDDNVWRSVVPKPSAILGIIVE